MSEEEVKDGQEAHRERDIFYLTETDKEDPVSAPGLGEETNLTGEEAEVEQR